MPDPTVRQMLVAKIDELVDMTTRDLDEIRAVTEQLEPERAKSCGNAITIATKRPDVSHRGQPAAPRPTGRGAVARPVTRPARNGL